MPRYLSPLSMIVIATGVLIGIGGCVEENFPKSKGNIYGGEGGDEAEIRDVNADLKQQEAALNN